MTSALYSVGNKKKPNLLKNNINTIQEINKILKVTDKNLISELISMQQ
jgi:hypothetical protein